MSIATTDLSLPQITEQFRAVVHEIIEAGGAVDEETDELHDALRDAADKKTEAYIAVLNELKAKVDGLKEVEQHYKDKRKAVENTVDRMKDMLLYSMQAMGEDVRETDLGTVRVQEASRRSLIIDVEVDDLPDVFKRVRVSADKSRMRDALDSDDPDVRMQVEAFCHLDDPTKYVRIYSLYHARRSASAHAHTRAAMPTEGAGLAPFTLGGRGQYPARVNGPAGGCHRARSVAGPDRERPRSEIKKAGTCRMQDSHAHRVHSAPTYSYPLTLWRVRRARRVSGSIPLPGTMRRAWRTYAAPVTSTQRHEGHFLTD